MQKFECNGCGGHLKEDGRFWVCENCGTKYVLGRNDEGDPFTYQPIEKKEVAFGQMGVKASEIKVENIAVKDIKLADNIDAEVFKESINIEINQNIKIISTFIAKKEWDAAQSQINQVLLADNSNAEAHWYGWMCDKHINNEDDLIKSFTSFSKNDGKKLDDILSNSTPAFAKHIVNLLFDKAYINDAMCFEIMSVILPYSKNELVLSTTEFKNKISNTINTVITKVYPQSFDYLLQCTLDEEDVDIYIAYLQEFGDNCNNPMLAQKYYSQIIEIDPGNLAVHRKLVNSDIKANSDVTKITSDFESLLKYSGDTNKEVIALWNFINKINPTTKNTSQFVWSLIGYHSEAPEALKSFIFSYVKILLQSSLWDEAQKYLQLILSFDSQNADAYFLLCLVRLQAKTENDIENKKNNLIDCPEFKKALALYQSAGNERRANELMEFTQKQKAKKKAIKIGIIVGVIIAAIIVLICIYNSAKYSTNISISFNDSAYADGWSYNELSMTFKAKSLEDIGSFEGVMTFYDEEGNKIAATRLNISNLPHGEEQELNITLDSDSAESLRSYHFESVKITFTTKNVYFANYKHKDLGEGKERTIKSITKSAKMIDAENEAKIKDQYDAAMKAYEAVNINSPTFQTDITNAIAKLDDIWNDILNSKTLLKDMYDRASKYEENKEYEKAYFLFSLLGNYDYEDSYSRASDCYYKASYNY